MAVIKTCLLLCLGALLLVAARSEVAGENGRVHEIESLSDWQGKLEEGRNSGKLVVAEFWASWCGPCRVMSLFFDKFSEEYDDVIFLKVNIDEQPDVSEEVGIRALPTFTAYRDGSKVDQLVGADPPALKKLIQKNLGAYLSSIV